MTKICIFPRVHGTGGMVSFKHKFTAGLAARGIRVTDDPEDKYDAMLVINGTRQLGALARARRRGIRVVQRLDGINWVQRRRRTSAKYFLRAEAGNALLALIRRWYADRVIYQSEFIRRWWQDWYGNVNKRHYVVHNGVDLNVYSPEGPRERPSDRYRLLVVEGSLAGGLSVGLDLAVDLASQMIRQYDLPVELMVVGNVDAERRDRSHAAGKLDVNFLGVVPREQIPQIDRSAHLYFSAEINPPCPNAVIEALACGLPVVGFDTGSLTELVTRNAGRVVPYGADPWKLESPDIGTLAYASAQVLADLSLYQRGAREHALEAFGLDLMMDRYLEALLEK
jgi:glycosyltransferase involved in cell wall biosynthesis